MSVLLRQDFACGATQVARIGSVKKAVQWITSALEYGTSTDGDRVQVITGGKDEKCVLDVTYYHRRGLRLACITTGSR